MAREVAVRRHGRKVVDKVPKYLGKWKQPRIILLWVGKDKAYDARTVTCDMIEDNPGEFTWRVHRKAGPFGRQEKTLAHGTQFSYERARRKARKAYLEALEAKE